MKKCYKIVKLQSIAISIERMPMARSAIFIGSGCKNYCRVLFMRSQDTNTDFGVHWTEHFEGVEPSHRQWEEAIG